MARRRWNRIISGQFGELRGLALKNKPKILEALDKLSPANIPLAPANHRNRIQGQCVYAKQKEQ